MHDWPQLRSIVSSVAFAILVVALRPWVDRLFPRRGPATRIAILVVAIVAVQYAVSPLKPWFDRTFPSGGSQEELVQKLASPEPDTIMTGLYFLTKRGDPVAVPRALELLRSPDDYLWLNAALYLGACKRPEAVPYLIKALRHTASRSDIETVGYLHAITGQDFGSNFTPWQQWWLADHPGFEFDWSSHLGPIPRLPKAH